MICTVRGNSNKPPGFDALRKKLDKEFLASRKKDKDLTISMFWRKTRARLAAPAKDLSRVFHGKCAFCEAKPAHVSTPQIEHYRPKSKFEELAFDWNNWLLSCGRCNQIKWAHFPMCGSAPCLLDPAHEDPSEHIGFSRARVFGVSQRGKRTIELVGLNRSPLEDDRALWLLQIDALLLLVVGADVGVAGEARNFLIWTMQDDAPYAAMTRAYLGEMTPKLASPKTPHAIVQLDEPQGRLRALIQGKATALAAFF